MNLTKEMYYETINEVNKKLEIVDQIKKEVSDLPLFKYAENNLIKDIMLNNVTKLEVLNKAPDSFHLYLINEDRDIYFKIEEANFSHKMLFLKKCGEKLKSLELKNKDSFKIFLEMAGYSVINEKEEFIKDTYDLDEPIMCTTRKDIKNIVDINDIIYFYNLIVPERHIEVDKMRIIEKRNELVNNFEDK